MVFFPVCLEALGRFVDCGWACGAWMEVACLAYGWVCGVHLVGVTAAEMNVEVVAGNEGLGVCVGVMAVAVWDWTVEAMEVDDMMVYAVRR